MSSFIRASEKITLGIPLNGIYRGFVKTVFDSVNRLGFNGCRTIRYKSL